MYDMADDLASLRCVRLVSRRAGRNLEGVDINSPHSAAAAGRRGAMLSMNSVYVLETDVGGGGDARAVGVRGRSGIVADRSRGEVVCQA